jgi:uncharacterized protein YvpB
LGRAANLAFAAFLMLAMTANTVTAASGVFVGREATVASRDGLNVRSEPKPGASVMMVADNGDFVHVLEGPLLEHGDEWYRVDYDGTIGWVSGSFLAPPRDRAAVSTRGNRGEVEANRVWLPVPYYSQFDGTAYQSANCGPSSLHMALAAFGKSISVQELRRAANRMQGTAGWYDSGISIDVLAELATQHGLVVRGLRQGGAYEQWTLEEVRQALRNGNLVIPQVHLASLPGHGRSSRAVDHYIVITGFDGNRFVYNDPAFSGGAGHGLSISEESLALAWRRGDYRFAAFSVGPGSGMESLVAPPPAPRRAEPLDLAPPQVDAAIAAARLDDKAPEPAPLPLPLLAAAPPVLPVAPAAETPDRGVLTSAPPAVQAIADAVAATYDATVTVGVEHVSSGVEQISHTANGPQLWMSLGLAGLLAGLGARRQMSRLPFWARLRAVRQIPASGRAEALAEPLSELRAETAAA